VEVAAEESSSTLAVTISFCPYRCPGCAHRYLTEAASLAQKEDFTRHCLAKWEDKIRPITAPVQRTAYRDKVCLNVQEVNKLWQWGMAARKEFYPLSDCPLQTPAVNHLLQQTMAVLNDAKIAQDEFPLKFILINGPQMVWVIKSKPQQAMSDKVLPILRAQQDKLSSARTSLWWHWNECCGRRVTTKKTWQKIWGADFAWANGLRFGPMCFRQVHPTIYAAALQKAANYFAFTSSPSSLCLVDLFCGIGTSLSFWVKYGLAEENILGVELNGEAIKFAAENFPHVTFLRGTPEQRIPQIIPWVEQREVYLFVNPPRLGLTTELRDFIGLNLRPQKIVYLSCSPGTLKRDLLDLTSLGLVVEEIFPFDFFPQTKHVENLVLLNRPAH